MANGRLTFNTLEMAGNIANDLELRDSPTGVPILDMRIATGSPYKPKNSDDWKENTVFIDVQCWDKVADYVFNNYRKGDNVLVRGELRQDFWEDRETGKRCSKVFIKPDKIKPINTYKGRQAQNGNSRRTAPSRPGQQGRLCDDPGDFGGGNGGI